MEQHQKCILANSTEQIHFWSKRSSLFSYDPLSSMTLSQTCAETRLICCPLRWKLASFKTLCFHKYCRNIEIQSWLYLQKQKTVDTSGQSVLYQFKIEAKTTSVPPCYGPWRPERRCAIFIKANNNQFYILYEIQAKTPCWGPWRPERRCATKCRWFYTDLTLKRWTMMARWRWSYPIFLIFLVRHLIFRTVESTPKSA